MEVEVSEELHDFKKYAMPVRAVHLSGREQTNDGDEDQDDYEA